MTDDPTAPLTQRTPDQTAAYADDHLIMALEACDLIHVTRQDAEDYLRDRLAAISDTWPTADELTRERKYRANKRVLGALGLNITGLGGHSA
jgi:hypothetical protein